MSSIAVWRSPNDWNDWNVLNDWNDKDAPLKQFSEALHIVSN